MSFDGMGLLGDTLGVFMLLCIGAGWYLFHARLGPFQRGSALSSRLGLDVSTAGLAPTAASGSAVSSTPTAGSGGGATSSASTGTIQTTPASTGGGTGTTAPPSSAPAYADVNAVDMMNNTLPPDASQPSVLSTPTYSPGACQLMCSANPKCRAAVFDTLNSVCTLKSAIDTSFKQDNAKTLFLQGTPLPTGTAFYNTNLTDGVKILTQNVPQNSDCTALCQGLPACSGAQFTGGNCDIMSSASTVVHLNSVTSDSWLKTNATVPASQKCGGFAC